MRDGQTARILAYLKLYPNEWIDMVTLSRVGSGKPTGFCASISRRAADIRQMGYNLENKTEQVEGQKYSYYRLNTTTPMSPGISRVRRLLWHPISQGNPLVGDHYLVAIEGAGWADDWFSADFFPAIPETGDKAFWQGRGVIRHKDLTGKVLYWMEIPNFPGQEI